MLVPKFTSNLTYESYEMSSEMYGYYEVSSSSNNGASILNAFDGNEGTFFESLPHNPLTLIESNGFTMYHSNGVVFNCTDFRTFNLASKGIKPDDACRWVGKVLPGTIIRNVVYGVSVNSLGGNMIEITKIAGIQLSATQALIDNPVLLPYTTAGVQGEWIQIKMPTFVAPTSYRVVASASVGWNLFGSFDGVNWTSIHTVATSTQHTQTLGVIQSYMYYRLVISRQTSQTFRIFNFELYNNSGRINSYMI
jgi:hypothetical protein